MFKYFSAAVITSILIICLTLIYSYNTSCGFLYLTPCGTLRGFPLPLMEEICIDNCISLYPDDTSSKIAWRLTDEWKSYFIMDMVFWLPASLIIIVAVNKYIMKSKNKMKSPDRKKH